MIRFDFRPYQRRFKQPLITHHGQWSVREGILLRLEDERGQVGFGEIAPVPWFGSESLDAAIAYCHQQSSELFPASIWTIPNHLPACQFGFESAWENLTAKASLPVQSNKLGAMVAQSALLPPGALALQAWKSLWQQGYRTFKWKIGVREIQTEMDILTRLSRDLPIAAKLRLDANGGLTVSEADQWLQLCDSLNIEFLEQPLPADHFDAMQQLAAQHSTPLALDESVATLDQLHHCWQRGWRGVFVIKPAIVGSPLWLRHFCQTTAVDAVFSSVLETAIGQQAALHLAAALTRNQRAVGFGTQHWFDPHDPLSQPEASLLWQHLQTSCNPAMPIG